MAEKRGAPRKRNLEYAPELVAPIHQLGSREENRERLALKIQGLKNSLVEVVDESRAFQLRANDLRGAIGKAFASGHDDKAKKLELELTEVSNNAIARYRAAMSVSAKITYLKGLYKADRITPSLNPTPDSYPIEDGTPYLFLKLDRLPQEVLTQFMTGTKGQTIDTTDLAS
jgi:regulator of replication initiation timing